MSRTIKFLLGLLGVFILGFLAWYLRTIIYYILIAAVLSFIGRPLVDKLNTLHIGKQKMPPAVSALIVLVIYISALSGLISLFVPLIAEEFRILSSIKVDEVIQSLQVPLNELEDWMVKNKMAAEKDLDLSEQMRKQLTGLVQLKDLPNMVVATIGKLGGIFITFFSIFFITFFFLKDDRLLYNMIMTVTPEEQGQRMENVLLNTKRLLSRYFIGILFQIIIITTVVSIGLSIVGIENALVIGLIAGVMNIVPYLGPIIGASIGVLVGVSTNLDLSFYSEMLPMIGEILLVFAFVQLLDNFVLQPVIFSTSAKAHPLEIFLVVLIGASLSGITGMILAIPVYTFIRIVAKEFLFEFKVVKKLTRDI